MEKNLAKKATKEIWLFNSGSTFSGNPKWLFLYIRVHRPDIEAYWICDQQDLVKKIRKLGHPAATFRSLQGEKWKRQADVFVVDQVKEHLPISFPSTIKILNLWHGVGCKTIERGVKFGELRQRIYQKHIRYYSVYQNNQLFLVTSPLMEKHFQEQIAIPDENLIRAGYPANSRESDLTTYSHAIKASKGLPDDAKIILYAPTYRDRSLTNFFGKAIPDMASLLALLQKQNALFIFKIHPLMAQDPIYQQLQANYSNHPNLLFWDNQQDIYEIFNQVDIAIVDYSSIFYDLLASGVKSFIRYIFDYKESDTMRDFAFDYLDMTFGTLCYDFETMLLALEAPVVRADVQTDIDRLETLFWEYDRPDNCEKIITATQCFQIKNTTFPTLYSFDIFDTLLRRKTLEPLGVFYYVQDKLQNSPLEFPGYFRDNYQRIRRQAEAQLRDYYRKSTSLRGSDLLEIQLEEIFARLQTLYDLTTEQTDYLMELELEGELQTIEGIPEQIAACLELKQRGETVVLISDMYLPETFMKQLLRKVHPELAELPLFLSSTTGEQKSTKKLYLRVFESLDYCFEKWIHHGDNQHADIKMAQSLGIETVFCPRQKFEQYERALVNRIPHYDGYLTAGLFANYRTKARHSSDYYIYAFVSMYFVPYVHWALKHALQQGTETVYFLSRDGHYLKLIADTLIALKKYPLRTKYLYGSRKAWRIPSFVEEIDEEFFSPFGNFEALTDFDSVLEALCVNEETFDRLFPELNHLKACTNITLTEKQEIIYAAKNSSHYRDFLLAYAKEKRICINQYFQQEINPDEKFVFIEYWGRGYTQDCFNRLLADAFGKPIQTVFYYARSIYPSHGLSIRHNFNPNLTSLVFVEAIFATVPYHSITAYQWDKTIARPVIDYKENTAGLHNGIQALLPEFIADFYQLPLLDEDALERSLFDFAIDYFRTSAYKNSYIIENFAPLKDSVRLHAKEEEYAPCIRLRDCLPKLAGRPIAVQTTNMRLSLARSSHLVRLLYQIEKKWLEKAVRQLKIRLRFLKRKLLFRS